MTDPTLTLPCSAAVLRRLPTYVTGISDAIGYTELCSRYCRLSLRIDDSLPSLTYTRTFLFGLFGALEGKHVHSRHSLHLAAFLQNFTLSLARTFFSITFFSLFFLLRVFFLTNVTGFFRCLQCSFSVVPY